MLVLRLFDFYFKVVMVTFERSLFTYFFQTFYNLEVGVCFLRIFLKYDFGGVMHIKIQNIELSLQNNFSDWEKVLFYFNEAAFLRKKICNVINFN